MKRSSIILLSVAGILILAMFSGRGGFGAGEGGGKLKDEN